MHSKKTPFFPDRPEARQEARYADRQVSYLFLFLFTLLCAAKWLTFGF